MVEARKFDSYAVFCAVSLQVFGVAGQAPSNVYAWSLEIAPLQESKLPKFRYLEPFRLQTSTLSPLAASGRTRITAGLHSGPRCPYTHAESEFGPHVNKRAHTFTSQMVRNDGLRGYESKSPYMRPGTIVKRCSCKDL